MALEITPPSLKSWKMAQNLEYDANKHIGKLASHSYVVKRAKLVEKWIRYFINLNSKSMILEIGGASMPVIDHFTTGKKFSLDPLEDQYKRLFRSRLNTDVLRIRSIGENMPYPDNFFDLIVMLNVLDHCYEPKKVLAESARILKSTGILFLSVNTTSRFWNILKKIKMRIWKNTSEKMHPYIFCRVDVLNMMGSFYKPTNILTTYIDILSGEPPGYHVMPNTFIERIKGSGRFYFIGNVK
ncbi:hypothetical protein ES703_68164 [subsurface metagenome]